MISVGHFFLCSRRLSSIPNWQHFENYSFLRSFEVAARSKGKKGRFCQQFVRSSPFCSHSVCFSASSVTSSECACGINHISGSVRAFSWSLARGGKPPCRATNALRRARWLCGLFVCAFPPERAVRTHSPAAACCGGVGRGEKRRKQISVSRSARERRRGSHKHN